MKQLVCKSCGRTVDVPEELDVFSCVYCGAKNAIVPDPVPDLPAEELAALEPLYPLCFEHRDMYLKRFAKKDYVDAFFAYEAQIRPLFTAMDALLCRESGWAEALGDALLDAKLRFHEGEKGWKSKAGRERILFDAKLLMAWFTLPAIKDLNLPTGELLAEAVYQSFLKRYPKEPIQSGTFEEINSGFRKRGLCFITTAVCEFEGKADDCAELTVFRAYRDGVLAREPGGPVLIAEYYRVAPGVVMALDQTPDRAARYARIRREWLTPCYDDLLAGRTDACRERYTEMVRTLEAELCPFLS